MKATFYVVFNTYWSGLSLRRVPKGIRLNLGWFQFVVALIDIEVEIARLGMTAAHLQRYAHRMPPVIDIGQWARQNAPSTDTRH